MGGMDRQTLRDWVIRYNEQGPDGLINIPSPGAPPKLDDTPARSASKCHRRCSPAPTR
jgi:transposase